jgi:hypothetical protein
MLMSVDGISGVAGCPAARPPFMPSTRINGRNQIPKRKFTHIRARIVITIKIRPAGGATIGT